MINKIANSPLFYSFQIQEIEKMIAEHVITITEYNENQIIHYDGEKCDKLEMIIEGDVVIERLKDDGSQLVISSFSEGDILGGNIVFSSNPHYLMNVISRRRTKIMELKKNDLFKLLKTNPDFLFTYLEFISDTTTILGNKLKYHMNLPLRQRITSYLQSLYVYQQSSEIKLDTSKKDIAAIIGCQRTSLSRELKKMEIEKILIVNRDKITLLKTELFQTKRV